MSLFDDSLMQMERALRAWNRWPGLTSVTFMRDIYGKVTLFVEGDVNRFAGFMEVLDQECKQRAGAYFGGRNLYIRAKMKPLEQEVADVVKRERTSYEPVIDFGSDADHVAFYILERTVAKRAWMLQKTESGSPWSYDDANEGRAPKIVTFYSFKGGMGRTTSLAGVGMLLARKGKHVIMVDTDIEAPGLASLFFPSTEITCGLLDYFMDKNIEPGTSISDYCLEFDLNELFEETREGSLRVISAGKVDSNYLTKLARLDLQEYRPHSLYNHISNMLLDIRDHYPDTDYILLDARAGFHDLGGVALGLIPHGAIIFGNDSDQSWEGIRQAVRCAALAQDDQLFLIMAASLSEPRSSERYQNAVEKFSRQSHAIFTDCYYRAGEAPGVLADEEPHSPVMIDYDERMRQNLHFYSIDGVADETRKTQIEMVMGAPYQELLRRLERQFE